MPFVPFERNAVSVRGVRVAGRSFMQRGGVALVCAVLAMAVTAGSARAADNLASEGGMGALAALATLPYGPVKIVYASGGLVFGGLAWVFSGGDHHVLEAVITPAVRGDYVLTPATLRGERDLMFFGQDPVYRDDIVADVDLVEEDLY